ncbi:cell division protein FtsW [Candidatus Falkowbacteria bacterium]|jgi:cell division protein FtsW|nr:cell division protein FtsW [Candidatus Falkowbacteria bacterium]
MSQIVVQKKTATIEKRLSSRPLSVLTRQPLDRFLLITVVLLCAIGLFCLASSSSVVAYTRYGDTYFWLKKQALSMFIGAVGFYFFSLIDYRKWQKLGGLMLVVTVGFLLTLFTPLAHEQAGATAWLNIFGFSLQPSEFVKLFLIIYLSALMAKLAASVNIEEKKRLNWSFWFVLAIIGGLILAQPDLGTLLIIAATSVVIYLLGGGSWRLVSQLAALGVIALVALVFIRGGYQKDRFLCVLKPNYSPDKSCYQVNQSLIAIGSGGFWGRGLGESRQKYLYLPEVQNDFIFPIIAEELGWWFSVILVLLYFALFYRGFQIARAAPDLYGQILAGGVVSGLMVQVFINLGGTINLFPMTGVPLPLISYGGSSLMSLLFGLGVLANISRQAKLPDNLPKL